MSIFNQQRNRAVLAKMCLCLPLLHHAATAMQTDSQQILPPACITERDMALQSHLMFLLSYQEETVWCSA